MMKKLLASFAVLAAFTGTAQAESISVAATAVPHAEILEFVKPALAKQGVELQIKVKTLICSSTPAWPVLVLRIQESRRVARRWPRH